MRAATITFVLLLGLIARADAPVPAQKAAPAGFDHAGHAKATAVACTQCHPVERGGALGAKAPGHATCFGKCHAEQADTLKLREPVPDDRLRYCNACHAETALVLPLDKKALAVTAVKTGVDTASSSATTRTRRSRARSATSPAPPARSRTRALHRMSRREERQDLSIAECAKCHPRNRSSAAGPRGDRRHHRVLAREHGTRGAAKQCATCHAGIAATDGRTLPSPKVETCAIAGCHDAKASFGTLTSCTKCHQDVPKIEFKVARPVQRFSHDRHEPHTKAPCAACHPLSKSGEVQITGHLACVDGCHKHVADFGARTPTMCGACHDGTEPWRVLLADKIPSDTTEFGATLDHRTAPVPTATRSPATGCLRQCRSCASGFAITGARRRDDGVRDCHRAANRERGARFAARWSVRALFRHRVHEQKAKVACAGCHTDLTSPTMLSLPVPAKATCSTAGCHDGRGAFKVTGTSCTRCHVGAKK
jgi:c(7)-type cytochrome triheme protein